ncbi:MULTISPECIES: cytochrome o ubiquinol oxidase subunit III [Bordetella]|uniref:Cytochrome bo(3) ubiquinol oxidase subunit 3 n=1 Tax=Bordetella genomosp. 6 TaxID=463024 RepID=A0ABX4F8Z0_9BORD|nr:MULTISPECIES: cytochrome o ubiquinol oxidase subunit III [Bordetella]AOB25856.1 cytochrome o ubiquinol oxidase subunit III [Bordetella bronchiseptica]ARP77878.1 cytochrome o ubiquinol oxidase subunit III [Bordetella genomosp. 6]AZW43128.1 cytochrome o ubiquinol oxidase subunit III [Bordetella bronchiseptica]KCV66639.1 cytochrome o ubiquinol oxidase, subunit III [Bordetella bronchiseptica 99-R-0433]MBN3268551.1 cytochrome o ubiquinol oxidase subunit III [Bordetella bronchiseptica]
MTNAVATHPHAGDHHGHHDDGSKTVLGFWIYLMSDLLIFSVLFATFAVLSSATAGGPGGKDLFDLSFVLGETMLLLVSSFTFGMAMLNLHAGNKGKVIAWLWVTFLFGAGFIVMEVYEFHHLLSIGAGPQTSAYLSAFFTLIGTHGLHVTFGLIWILVMIHMLSRYGIDPITTRRLSCLSLFWHFLDIVWICVFTFVYLMGAL